MYTYSAVQWLFFFYFYCVAGWCFESTYVSIRKRRLVNRGDVIAAYAGDAAEKRKKERSQRLEELFASLETRFQKARENRGSSAVTAELDELRERFAELKCRREQLREVKGIYKRHLLLNHPSMRSERFKEALELLKRSAAERGGKAEKEEKEDGERG